MEMYKFPVIHFELMLPVGLVLLHMWQAIWLKYNTTLVQSTDFDELPHNY